MRREELTLPRWPSALDGLRVLPEVRPSSRLFLTATVAGLAGIVTVSLVIP